MIDEELTGRVIRTFYSVYNSLGYGFIEGVYHNAMILEFCSSGISFETEKSIAVYYGENVVGRFSADLVVEERIILELKAKQALSSAHEAQLLNYLRATDIELGLLLNFGQTPEFRRKYFSNVNKKRTGRDASDTPILKSLLKKDPPESA